MQQFERCNSLLQQMHFTPLLCSSASGCFIGRSCGSSQIASPEFPGSTRSSCLQHSVLDVVCAQPCDTRRKQTGQCDFPQRSAGISQLTQMYLIVQASRIFHSACTCACLCSHPVPHWSSNYEARQASCSVEHDWASRDVLPKVGEHGVVLEDRENPADSGAPAAHEPAPVDDDCVVVFIIAAATHRRCQRGRTCHHCTASCHALTVKR